MGKNTQLFLKQNKTKKHSVFEIAQQSLNRLTEGGLGTHRVLPASLTKVPSRPNRHPGPRPPMRKEGQKKKVSLCPTIQVRGTPPQCLSQPLPSCPREWRLLGTKADFVASPPTPLTKAHWGFTRTQSVPHGPTVRSSCSSVQCPGEVLAQPGTESATRLGAPSSYSWLPPDVRLTRFPADSWLLENLDAPSPPTDNRTAIIVSEPHSQCHSLRLRPRVTQAPRDTGTSSRSSFLKCTRVWRPHGHEDLLNHQSSGGVSKQPGGDGPGGTGRGWFPTRFSSDSSLLAGLTYLNSITGANSMLRRAGRPGTCGISVVSLSNIVDPARHAGREAWSAM